MDVVDDDDDDNNNTIRTQGKGRKTAKQNETKRAEFPSNVRTHSQFSLFVYVVRTFSDLHSYFMHCTVCINDNCCTHNTLTQYVQMKIALVGCTNVSCISGVL